MTFRPQANIDANSHKGLVLMNSITNATLIATGLSLTNAQPLHVAIVDGSGSQITTFGGGTQYTDGGVPPTHPIGNTIEWSDGSNWQTVSTAKPLPVSASFSPSGTQDVNLTKVGGTSFSLGQQLAAASIPIVLTAAQIITLTPPGAITNYALETGGNLATLAGAVTSSIVQSNVAKINNVTPLMGNGVTGTGSQRVTIASDNTAFSVNATLSAETTKVIGVTRTADGSGNLLTSTTNALDVNLKTSALSNFSTNVAQINGVTPLMGNGVTGTGSQRVTIASDNTAFSVNATLSAETTKVIGVTRTADGSGNLITSTGNALDINIKSGNPTTIIATQATGTNLHTVIDSGTITAVTAITNALPAGTNALGTVNLSPTATGGWSPYFANAVTTVVTVSGSAGKFGGYMLINLNSAPAYLQVFDTIGAVTLGSTTPTFVIPLPANSTAANGLAANIELANGIVIANGIKVAATTASNGASTVSTGLSGSIWYK